MTMMTLRGQHDGSLSLTPEHLGPVEVRISVSQNTAHVWFGAQHADARAALAEALPRLREMFGDAGMTLGHADVSQQAPRQGSREGALTRVGVAQVDGVDVVDTTNQPAVRVALGLVDTYV
jgi:flagellar hook-length control protein FliK